MAPPPPTLAKFAGFVEWSQRERAQGRGICFGIVPHGVTAAIGILEVRSLDSTSSDAELGIRPECSFLVHGRVCRRGQRTHGVCVRATLRVTRLAAAHRSAQPARTGCHAESPCAA